MIRPVFAFLKRGNLNQRPLAKFILIFSLVLAFVRYPMLFLNILCFVPEFCERTMGKTGVNCSHVSQRSLAKFRGDIYVFTCFGGIPVSLLNNKRLATEMTLYTITVRYHCNPNIVPKPAPVSFSRLFLLCAESIFANELRKRRLRQLNYSVL